LKSRGFERVRPLEGGLEAWRERGFPVVTADEHGLASPLIARAR